VITKLADLKPTNFLLLQALLEPVALLSVISIGKDHFSTRQSLCRVWRSAKFAWQNLTRRRRFAECFFLGHSAKITNYFAECVPRHSAKFFCRYTVCRQHTFCRVHGTTLGKCIFIFFMNTLPSASFALGKVLAENSRKLFCINFAECRGHSTRQSNFEY